MPSTITKEELCRISDNLLSKYFIEHDLYSLMCLGLMTVSEYSTKKHHLPTEQKTETTLLYIPDLLEYLNETTKISGEEYRRLKTKLRQREKELPQILHSYMYLTHIQRRNSVEDVRKRDKCCKIV